MVPALQKKPGVYDKELLDGLDYFIAELGRLGMTAVVTLNNFCKLQEMGPDDEDDILSCVSFLLVDVLHARDLLAADLQ